MNYMINRETVGNLDLGLLFPRTEVSLMNDYVKLRRMAKLILAYSTH